MRLLKVASTAAKRGDNGCRSVGFEHRLGQPLARTHVHKIGGGGGRSGVVEVRPFDSAQPVEALGVAGPDERSVLDFGEPGDAASEPFFFASVVDSLAEAAQAQPAGALDGRAQIDIVAAGPHRRAVYLGHTDHPARYAAAVATIWRYVKIQLMVFVFGIVGPIFLAVYFATQPDPSMKWFYWIGLFITAADVLIALAVTNASDPKKTPADTRFAIAVAKRMQPHRGHAGESSSSTYDPFSATALTFATDSGSSSNDYSSSDYSSSDSGSSDSGSSDSSSSDSSSSSSSD
jgi:hypothetical protein